MKQRLLTNKSLDISSNVSFVLPLARVYVLIIQAKGIIVEPVKHLLAVIFHLPAIRRSFFEYLKRFKLANQVFKKAGTYSDVHITVLRIGYHKVNELP